MLFIVDTAYRMPQNCPPNFGGVPEWPKGADCKSAAQASMVRIRPPPPFLSKYSR